eukprot:TRINITY_DN224_c2_g1_i1.p2 TRINITY_DN224_c2_g1~~TRINITY_DN224_c2_g1_i1.p2  ORF type:complete len:236 (+),score=-9.93 TRINITY_DN224_c2_g1_i1:174-881(+)
MMMLSFDLIKFVRFQNRSNIDPKVRMKNLSQKSGLKNESKSLLRVLSLLRTKNHTKCVTNIELFVSCKEYFSQYQHLKMLSLINSTHLKSEMLRDCYEYHILTTISLYISNIVLARSQHKAQQGLFMKQMLQAYLCKKLFFVFGFDAFNLIFPSCKKALIKCILNTLYFVYSQRCWQQFQLQNLCDLEQLVNRLFVGMHISITFYVMNSQALNLNSQYLQYIQTILLHMYHAIFY